MPVRRRACDAGRAPNGGDAGSPKGNLQGCMPSQHPRARPAEAEPPTTHDLTRQTSPNDTRAPHHPLSQRTTPGRHRATRRQPHDLRLHDTRGRR